MNIALIGFGNVGRSLLLELIQRGFSKIKLVVSSKGYVLVDDHYSLTKLIELAENGLKLENHPSFRAGYDWLDLPSQLGVEIAFITIPPSYESGEPNKSIYYKLVEQGVSIITADKTVLAREYHVFMENARKRNTYVGYRATVAAGTPVLDVVRGVRGRAVEAIKGVLNATTNYILMLMHTFNYSYEQAVEKAILDKYAEPDPRIDTHGWDAAAKLTIILCELGYHVSINHVVREPLDKVSIDMIREAGRENKRIIYLAEADLLEKKYVVHPVSVNKNDPLALIKGTYNRVEIFLENEKIAIEGPAGPASRTAKAMITDLLEYLDRF